MSVNFANKPDLQWGLNKFDCNCKQKVISNQAVFVKLCKKVVCVCVCVYLGDIRCFKLSLSREKRGQKNVQYVISTNIISITE